MSSRSKYDGTVFSYENAGHIFPQSVRRTDPLSITKYIRQQCETIASTVEAIDLKGAPQDVMNELLAKCDEIDLHHKHHDCKSTNGLTLKLTPGALIELGYLWCQFLIIQKGFERLAGIGKKVSYAKRGSKPTKEARGLIEAGKGERTVAKLCFVERAVARRWIKLIRGEKEI